MISLEHIRGICSGRIAIGEPLARLTTFRIGGAADLYVEPMRTDEVLALITYFRRNDIRYMVLGNGSNVLIHDDGYSGAVINLEAGFSGVSIEEGIVTAGAGARLSAFVDFCILRGFAGTDPLAGIPGTLGGGLIMNAGAYGAEISDHLLDVTVVRGDDVVTLRKDECDFRYRHSGLRDAVVLSARFALPEGDTEDMKKRRKELLLTRNAAQPTNLPNAGSIFKNPEGQYAARLIEQCGLKGYTFGGATVSTLHANFIVGSPSATAADILAVINHVRRTVYRHTGVALELEVLLVGFGSDAIAPLADPRAEVAR
ncbi:MAG: UDP-N-acetylmuramate dehydrogenase [Ignavibacteriae bacterium]|nr:UDP-N-acetylmuramate dehydrogenase [Ignavibacteriota bacterium]